MGMPAAANSVLAKARAMYGKRMTAQNYSELLSCRSVGEAASYLREHTAYRNVFDGVPMGALHRRQLETLVHDHLSTQFASLCRYEKFIGDGFSAHFVMRSDVELLLHAIRRINRTHPDDFPKVKRFVFKKQKGKTHINQCAKLFYNRRLRTVGRA